MLRILAVLALLLAAGTGTAAAQEAWPARPPRLVVPFPPGSISDAIARMVADRIAGPLGQRLVIDNRSGAAGNLGTSMSSGRNRTDILSALPPRAPMPRILQFTETLASIRCGISIQWSAWCGCPICW